MIKINFRLGCFVVAALLLATAASSDYAAAADKTWTGGSATNASDWFDETNWQQAAKPTASDDAVVDLLDASVDVSQTVAVKSLTLGGKKASTLTVDNFVTGTIEPTNTTDLAVFNRKGGLLIMKGSAGKLTLKGVYKDSEETVPDEPSFMFYVQ